MIGIGIGLAPGLVRGAGGGAPLNLYTALKAYWKLDESSAGSSAVQRNDSIGTYHLTDNSTVPSAAGVVYPLAASMGTSSEYLSHAHDAGLSPGADDFALAAWIYIPAISTTRVVIGKFATGDREFQLGHFPTNFFRWDLSTNGSTIASQISATDVTLVAGNWYFVVCWIDTANAVSGIQVNGGIRHVGNYAGPVFAGSQALKLGHTSFTGRIGPAMLWRGYIPTEDDVTWLYNDGAGRTLADMETYQQVVGIETLAPTITEIAADGYASTTRINSVTYRDSAIATVNIGGTDYQALAYWDNNGRLVLGKRVQGGAWTLYPYDGTGGRPTIGPVTNDEHNVANIGLDPNGYIHVAYDHHGVALKYRKSDAPINTWTGGISSTLSMLGTNESQVTYPTFVNDPSGKLYFLFRDGTSGNGDLYIYKYNEGAATWAAVAGTTAGKVIDGKTSAENPYYAPPRFDADFGSGGYMHIMWVWRRTTNVTTNHDICHVRWDGTNWTTIAGDAQTIPITLSNDYVAVAIAESSGLSNQDTCDTDSQGRPHYAYIRNGTGGYAQIHHVYHNGTSWVTRELTLTGTPSFATDPYAMGRPFLLIDHADDRAYIIYHDEAETRNKNGLMLLYSEPNDYTVWTKAILTTQDVGVYEPNGDYQYWRSNGVIQLCVAPWSSGGTAWPIQLLEWTPEL